MFDIIFNQVDNILMIENVHLSDVKDLSMHKTIVEFKPTQLNVLEN